MNKTNRKGYQNRAERITAVKVEAEKVWQAAYTRALGWDPDPEGVAHKAMSAYLAAHQAP